MDRLTLKVASRAMSAAIHWTRYPGGVAKITQTPGGGPYAKSEDGRFMIFVSRYLSGDPGNRSYSYHFSAVDYGIPSGGRRFTAIMVEPSRESSVNVKKVMAAVEKWAQEHPLTESKTAALEIGYGPAGTGLTYQKDFPPTTECHECGEDARLALVVREPSKEEVYVNSLYPNEPDAEEFWPHEATAFATYICPDPDCAEATTLWNQA